MNPATISKISKLYFKFTLTIFVLILLFVSNAGVVKASLTCSDCSGGYIKTSATGQECSYDSWAAKNNWSVTTSYKYCPPPQSSITCSNSGVTTTSDGDKIYPFHYTASLSGLPCDGKTIELCSFTIPAVSKDSNLTYNGGTKGMDLTLPGKDVFTCVGDCYSEFLAAGNSKKLSVIGSEGVKACLLGVPFDVDVSGKIITSPVNPLEIGCTGKFLSPSVNINNKDQNVQWTYTSTGKTTGDTYAWGGDAIGSEKTVYSYHSPGTANAQITANTTNSIGNKVSSTATCTVPVPLSVTCSASLVAGTSTNVQVVATPSSSTNIKYIWGGGATGAANQKIINIAGQAGKTLNVSVTAEFTSGGKTVKSSNTNNTCHVVVPADPIENGQCGVSKTKYICDNLHGDAENEKDDTTNSQYTWTCMGYNTSTKQNTTTGSASCTLPYHRCTVIAYNGFGGDVSDPTGFTSNVDNLVQVFKASNPGTEVDVIKKSFSNAGLAGDSVLSDISSVKNNLATTKNRILIAAHSISSIGTFNVRNQINANQVILYDPPYNAFMTQDWLPGIQLLGMPPLSQINFSQNVTAIQQARSKKIFNSPEIVNMSGGLPFPWGKWIQEHVDFSKLPNLVTPWLNANCSTNAINTTSTNNYSDNTGNDTSASWVYNANADNTSTVQGVFNGLVNQSSSVILDDGSFQNLDQSI